METATVLENGDLQLPPEVAVRLNARTGDSVPVQIDPDGTLHLFSRPLKSADLCGMLRDKTSVTLTVEQMDEAVAEAFRRGEL